MGVVCCWEAASERRMRGVLKPGEDFLDDIEALNVDGDIESQLGDEKTK